MGSHQTKQCITLIDYVYINKVFLSLTRNFVNKQRICHFPFQDYCCYSGLCESGFSLVMNIGGNEGTTLIFETGQGVPLTGKYSVQGSIFAIPKISALKQV